MKLSKFSVVHFRCLYNVQDIPLHSMTVLIGENDGGKSATLDALGLFFNRGGIPTDRDYSFVPGVSCADADDSLPREPLITLEAEFELGPDELGRISEVLLAPVGSLKVRKSFCRGDPPQLALLTSVPVDPRLRGDPDALSLPQVKALLADFGVPSPGGTAKEPYVQVYKEWLRTQPVEPGWQPIPKQIIALLPDYEIVRGNDPESVVKNMLSVTWRDELQREDNRQLIEQLEGNLRGSLQDRASSLKEVVHRYVPAIQDVQVDPQFSFEGAFQRSPLQLVGANGKPIDLAMRGTGLRQQVTMATYEWSSGVMGRRSPEEARQLILAFDEPDIHLDYRAQRHLYNTLEGFVEKDLQVVIATHSINFINRVPVHQINHYAVTPDHSGTIVEYLRTSEDSLEQEFFLNELGRSMGLENSTMFHERCFLAYEGKTEDSALPILFRKLFQGVSTHARGVRLVNAYDNYGAIVFAKFMHRNKREVLFMVDEDTTLNKGTARLLTPQALAREGFPEERAHIVRPGCFEFAFPNGVWARVLTKHQYEGTNTWTAEDIQDLRGSPKEFQSAVERILQESKPRIGVWLAEAVEDPMEIPEDIRACLEHADAIANLPSPALVVDMRLASPATPS